VKTADVVIIGSGSLANGIVYALSQMATGSFRVAIIGRSTVKVEERDGVPDRVTVRKMHEPSV
jgi:shikimate 5-dehydrogenase